MEQLLNLEGLAELSRTIKSLVVIVLFAERFTEYTVMWLVEQVGKWTKYEPDRAFWAKLSVLLIGAALSGLARLNMFDGVIDFIHPAVGMVMTALVVGSGTELLHQMIEGFRRIGR